MHLVGEQQKRPNKGRLGTEQAFKRINNCVLAVHLACFLTVISLVSIAGGKTFAGNLWSTSIELDEVIATKTANCSQTIMAASGGWKEWSQVVSPDDLFFRFATFAGRVKLCMGLNLACLLIGAINKLAFDVNIFEIRIRHLIIRKELLSAAEFLFIIFSYVSASDVESDATILRNYLSYCGVTSQNSLPYEPPFVALYVGLSWTVFIHVICFIILCWNTLQEPAPIPTTRDKFGRLYDDAAKQKLQEIEHTKPYPDDHLWEEAAKSPRRPRKIPVINRPMYAPNQQYGPQQPEAQDYEQYGDQEQYDGQGTYYEEGQYQEDGTGAEQL